MQQKNQKDLKRINWFRQRPSWESARFAFVEVLLPSLPSALVLVRFGSRFGGGLMGRSMWDDRKLFAILTIDRKNNRSCW